jgi:3-methyladenine DNA glycosylase AlkD
MKSNDLIQIRYDLIRAFCKQNADEKLVIKYARYFKDGYDAWGIDSNLLKNQIKQWITDWKNDWNLNDYFRLGNLLIQSGKYEEASFAILFVANHKKQFTTETFQQIGYWLENGIRNWAHTDVICSELTKPLIQNKIIDIQEFTSWLNSSSSWKQRAIPVSLIHAVKDSYEIEPLLAIINPLMDSKIKEVQQGLGWFLREAWRIHPSEVESFLLKWKNTCGRLIIQYATEKMGKEQKLIFKKEK